MSTGSTARQAEVLIWTARRDVLGYSLGVSASLRSAIQDPDHGHPTRNSPAAGNL
jgi:hypothetical protein